MIFGWRVYHDRLRLLPRSQGPELPPILSDFLPRLHEPDSQSHGESYRFQWSCAFFARHKSGSVRGFANGLPRWRSPGCQTVRCQCIILVRVAEIGAVEGTISQKQPMIASNLGSWKAVPRNCDGPKFKER